MALRVVLVSQSARGRKPFYGWRDDGGQTRQFGGSIVNEFYGWRDDGGQKL